MIILAVCLSIILLILLGGSIYAYLSAFYSPAKRKVPKDAIPHTSNYDKARDVMHTLAAELKEKPFEEIYITSYDGKRLFGRYYHMKDGAPLQIQFHGYKGSAYRDFCGGSRLAMDISHNIILVDQRAHGKSEGRTITFGVKERLDCKAWVEYATSRFGNIPIFIVGVSMGGATVLMASDLDLPDNVVGVIADCPYSSPASIIKKVCREQLRLPPRLVFPLVTLGGFLFGHFNVNSQSAVKSVKNAKFPILIIHGEADGFVPCDMSREIFDACAFEKYLYTFEGADHGLSYIMDNERYKNITGEFIDKQLTKFYNKIK
ncbi:MAG: alpha/beta fold hydrolase [Clostridia bacterium]|nr:alpha/beta fold hydrolase [Clostridia bacterium]